MCCLSRAKPERRVPLLLLGFARKHTAPRISDKNHVDLTLIIDNASVELFADNGLTVMASIFFPNENFSNIAIQSAGDFKLTSLQFNKLKGIYESSAIAASQE